MSVAWLLQNVQGLQRLHPKGHMAPWVEEEGGQRTISRIHLTRGEGAHDELPVGDSAAVGQGTVEPEYVAKPGLGSSQRHGSHRFPCCFWNFKRNR